MIKLGFLDQFKSGHQLNPFEHPNSNISQRYIQMHDVMIMIILIYLRDMIRYIGLMICCYDTTIIVHHYDWLSQDMYGTIKVILKIILSRSIVNQKLTNFFESINQLVSKECFKYGSYLIRSVCLPANLLVSKESYGEPPINLHTFLTNWISSNLKLRLLSILYTTYAFMLSQYSIKNYSRFVMISTKLIMEIDMGLS